MIHAYDLYNLYLLATYVTLLLHMAYELNVLYYYINNPTYFPSYLSDLSKV